MNTAIYGILGVLAFSYYKRKKSKVSVYYVKSILGNYNGIMIPLIGVFIKESERGNQKLLNHELIHWEQYKREGLIMIPNYIVENLRNGYDKNPYEIESRVNENDYCKYNYTECVRSGISNTISNPNFRK